MISLSFLSFTEDPLVSLGLVILVIKILRMHVSGGFMRDPEGKPLSRGSIRKGRDHLRYRVRRRLASLVVEQFSPYARCRSLSCNRRLNGNLCKNRETNPIPAVHLLPNIDRIICLVINAPGLKAGNGGLTYQANYEKDIPPTLADETDRLFVEAMRPNRGISVRLPDTWTALAKPSDQIFTTHSLPAWLVNQT